MQSKPLSTIFVAFAVVFGISYAIVSRQDAASAPDDSDWLYVDHDVAVARSPTPKPHYNQKSSILGDGWPSTIPFHWTPRKRPNASRWCMCVLHCSFSLALRCCLPTP